MPITKDTPLYKFLGFDTPEEMRENPERAEALAEALVQLSWHEGQGSLVSYCNTIKWKRS